MAESHHFVSLGRNMAGPEQVRSRPGRGRRGGQAGPRHWPRRGDPTRDPGWVWGSGGAGEC